MHITDFNPQRLDAGRCHRLFLRLTDDSSGDLLGIPVLYARQGSGATLVVLACVHGDEFEGVAAIHRVFSELDVRRMSGALMAVPVVNLPAVRSCSRTSPVDHLNLARVFPGRIDGTLSERLAYFISEYIIARADLLLDLHSAGSRYSMPLLCGFYWSNDDLGKRSRQAARAFGAPVLWQHSEVHQGRTLSAAFHKGIPAVYAEATGGSWIREHDVGCYNRGIRNLMRHLKIIEGEVERDCQARLLEGGGDLDFSVNANCSGFLMNKVELLQKVVKGDVLATVVNLFGDPVDEIQAPHDGYVMMRRETPMIVAGELVYALASREIHDS